MNIEQERVEFAEIRKALEMNPSSGPWKLSAETPTIIKQEKSGTLIGTAHGYVSSERCPMREQAIANAHLIAACDPDTIRRLLSKVDALQEALEEIRSRLANLPAHPEEPWEIDAICQIADAVLAKGHINDGAPDFI